MTIDERIEKANEKVNNYWNMMNIARKYGDSGDEEYWMYKWAAACEVYELITGTTWKPVK